MKFTLSPKTRSETLHITNTSDFESAVQMTALDWTQEHGADVTVPTDDVVIFPQIITIPPGEERIVRIAPQKKMDAAGEHTYRIRMDEIPVDSHSTTGVQMVLSMSVPIFFPPEMASYSGSIGDVSLKKNTLTIPVLNDGNLHFRPKELLVTGFNKAGETIFENAISGWYVLADRTYNFMMKLDGDQCGSLVRLKAGFDTNELQVEKTADIAPGGCDESVTQ